MKYLLWFFLSIQWINYHSSTVRKTYTEHDEKATYPFFVLEEPTETDLKTFTFEFTNYQSTEVSKWVNESEVASSSKAWVTNDHPQFYIDITIAFWFKIALATSADTVILEIQYDGTKKDEIKQSDTAASGVEGRGQWQLLVVEYYTESTSAQIKRIIRSRYRNGTSLGTLNGTATDVSGFELPSADPQGLDLYKTKVILGNALAEQIKFCKVFFDAFSDKTENDITELGYGLSNIVGNYPLFAYDRMTDSENRETYLHEKVHMYEHNKTQVSIAPDGLGSFYYNLTDSSGAPSNLYITPEELQGITNMEVFWSPTTAQTFDDEIITISFWYMTNNNTFGNNYMIRVKIYNSDSAATPQYFTILPMNYDSSSKSFSSIKICIEKNDSCDSDKSLTITCEMKEKYWYLFQINFANNYLASTSENVQISVIVSSMTNASLNKVSGMIKGADSGFVDNKAINEIAFGGSGGVTQLMIYKGSYSVINQHPDFINKFRYLNEHCTIGYFAKYFVINSSSALTKLNIDSKCLLCALENLQDSKATFHRYVWEGEFCSIGCKFTDKADLKTHRCIDTEIHFATLNVTKYPESGDSGYHQVIDPNLCGNGIVEWHNYEQCDYGLEPSRCSEDCQTVRSSLSLTNNTCIYDQTGFGTCLDCQSQPGELSYDFCKKALFNIDTGVSYALNMALNCVDYCSWYEMRDLITFNNTWPSAKDIAFYHLDNFYSNLGTLEECRLGYMNYMLKLGYDSFTLQKNCEKCGFEFNTKNNLCFRKSLSFTYNGISTSAFTVLFALLMVLQVLLLFIVLIPLDKTRLFWELCAFLQFYYVWGQSTQQMTAAKAILQPFRWMCLDFSGGFIMHGIINSFWSNKDNQIKHIILNKAVYQKDLNDAYIPILNGLMDYDKIGIFAYNAGLIIDIFLVIGFILALIKCLESIQTKFFKKINRTGRIIIAIFRQMASKSVITRQMDFGYTMFLYYALIDYLFMYKPATNSSVRSAMNFDRLVMKVFLFWMGIMYPISIFQSIYFNWSDESLFKDNPVLFGGMREINISKILPIIYILRRIFVIQYFVPGFEKNQATLFVILLVFFQLLVLVLQVNNQPYEDRMTNLYSIISNILFLIISLCFFLRIYLGNYIRLDYWAYGNDTIGTQFTFEFVTIVITILGMFIIYFVIGINLLLKNRKVLGKKLKERWSKFSQSFVASDDTSDKKKADMSIGNKKPQDKYKNI